MIEKRAIFPIIMFTMAGISFAFGIGQYVYARSVRTASAERMAYIMTSIERSDVGRANKQELYASIMTGLPKAPSLFGIDVSGSFASQGVDDHCTSDGQRTICKALSDQATDVSTMNAICGVCRPQ